MSAPPSSPAGAPPARLARALRLPRAGAVLVRSRLGAPRAPLVLLGAVAAASLGARVLWLDNPSSALIFDEKYYVNAARVVLGLPVLTGDPYFAAPHGIDPNSEHPPLAKLLIAGGMRLFGDNPLGWRFASLVFGTLALLAVYWLVRAAGGNPWAALGAATLMAVDNLSLVHGRIATLDVFALVPMLVAVALYLRGRALYAGVVLGVACCMKLVAAEVVLVVLLLEVARALMHRGDAGAPGGRDRLLALATFTGAAVVTDLALLAVLDVTVTAYRNPLAHTRYMLDYAARLRSPEGPQGIASYPWQWLLNQEPINYFTVTGKAVVHGVTHTYPVVAFQGLMNPFVVYLALPALAVSVHSAWRHRDDVAALAVAWSLGTFLPFVLGSALDQRTSYLYYMLVVLPGIYLALTRLFSRRHLPAAATVGYACALGYGFWSLYPFRTWTGA